MEYKKPNYYNPEEDQENLETLPKDSRQGLLFENKEYWELEWEGMPEFIQKDLTPIKQVIVSFASKEDIRKFSKLVGQTITMNTKSIWYPEVHFMNLKEFRYEDE